MVEGVKPNATARLGGYIRLFVYINLLIMLVFNRQRWSYGIIKVGRINSIYKYHSFIWRNILIVFTSDFRVRFSAFLIGTRFNSSANFFCSYWDALH